MTQQSLAAAKLARRNILRCKTITLYLPLAFAHDALGNEIMIGGHHEAQRH